MKKDTHLLSNTYFDCNTSNIKLILPYLKSIGITEKKKKYIYDFIPHWISIDANMEFSRENYRPNSDLTKIFFQNGELQLNKTPTIMNRLKDSFNEIEKLSNAKTYILNKSQERSHNVGWETYYKKGVDSEFIKIFKIDDKVSFSFALNNLSDKVENLHTTISIKTGAKITSNGIVGFDNIKIMIRDFIKNLRGIPNISNTKVLKALDNTFNLFNNQNTLNQEKIINDETNRLNNDKIIKPHIINYMESEKNIEQQSKTIIDDKAFIKDMSKKYSDSLGIEKLEIELARKKSELAKYTKSITSDKDLVKKQKIFNKSKDDNSKLKDEIIYLVEKKINKNLPIKIQRTIIERYTDIDQEIIKPDKEIIETEKENSIEFLEDR